jgi:serine/threonine protein kinase
VSIVYAMRDCPGSECWQALLAATLPPDQRERCERHIESCAACQARLAQTDEGSDMLLQMARQVGDPTQRPFEPALTEILERLREARSPVRPIATEPADLYFLRPADRPELLGTLGEYEVIEVIGQGGFGVVLKAYEPALHRLVAIKVMSPALSGSATARRRFTREAQAAAAVCHDHIVTVHGVKEADGLPYLVMQYVSGESLQARLDRTGPLELVEIVRIGLQTASGLAAAHVQGLIHRDIKPANLLLESGLARVKITDFGLARTVDDVGLTQDGVVAGTPEYMAPEQARGETVDPRCDLFSLGSVLYAMCTGVPPFRASSTVALLRQVSDHEPRPIRSLNPEVPAWLEGLVARLMAKNPAERFQSAAEVAALLEGYLAHLRQPTTVLAPELPPITAELCPDSSDLEAATKAPRFSRRGWGPAIVLLALLGIASWFAAGGGNGLSSENVQEFFHSFEGSTDKPKGLELFGPQADQQVKLEPGGLRITLPAGYQGQRPSTGLVTTFGVKGDFEITVGFEILLEEREQGPTDKITRFSLAVIPQKSPDMDSEQWIKPSQNLASLSHALSLTGKTMFLTWTTQWDPNAAKDEGIRHEFATTAKTGRLRLVRNGAELSYFVSEGADSDFTLLQKDPFGEKDLRQVRITGTTAGPTAALDVRVTDLRVRAASLTKVPPALRKRTWWKTVLVLGSMIAALPLGVWLWVRQLRAAKAPSGVSGQGPQTGQESKPAVVVMACPGCGKNLKVRTALAGRKVKCPECGTKVDVPEGAKNDPDRSRSDATRRGTD